MMNKIIDLYNHKSRYDIIYVDPPWKQSKGGLRKSRPNQAKELDYQTMSLQDIADVQKHVADNIGNETHTVFMWSIDKYLHESEKMMTDLGYKLHARMVWDKENGVAPAFTIRYAHEYLLWFYKPKMIKIATDQRGKHTTVIRERATKHSKKPLSAYEFIESIYPTQSKLEMYARNYREGWDSWGNELECHKVSEITKGEIIMYELSMNLYYCENSDPLEVSYEAGSVEVLKLDVEKAILNTCKAFGEFGKMRVEMTIQKAGIYYDSDEFFVDVDDNGVTLIAS